MSNNARFGSIAIPVLAILNLSIPAGLKADDSTVQTSVTTAPSQPKQNHKHKKKVNSAATSHTTAAPAVDAASNRKPAAANTDAPGMSDSLGINNPGSPNMGASDHTPGTTGTSGQ